MRVGDCAASVSGILSTLHERAARQLVRSWANANSCHPLAPSVRAR